MSLSTKCQPSLLGKNLAWNTSTKWGPIKHIWVEKCYKWEITHLFYLRRGSFEFAQQISGHPTTAQENNRCNFEEFNCHHYRDNVLVFRNIISIDQKTLYLVLIIFKLPYYMNKIALWRFPYNLHIAYHHLVFLKLWLLSTCLVTWHYLIEVYIFRTV